MKIKVENPPMLESILAAGMIPNLQTTIFTYGDTIYNPGDNELPDHLIEHEDTHSKQQGDDPDAWWLRYVNDPYFRLQQEIEAYVNQYKFICKQVTDRNKRFLILVCGNIYLR